MDRGLLAQSQPSAAAESLIYTAPQSTTATISTMFICNQGAATTFRVRVAFRGEETATTRQYIYYGTAIAANDTIAVTGGMTLSDGESMYGYSVSGNVSFSLFGGEA